MHKSMYIFKIEGKNNGKKIKVFVHFIKILYFIKIFMKKLLFYCLL